MKGTRPIRILQVVGGMNRGGTETWLMHVLRHIDRRVFQLDFLAQTREQCAYDAEIRSLGASIIPCELTGRPLHYAKRLLDILKHRGPYDVLHSHVHHFSGFLLWIAKMAGVPVRIAHSHSDTVSLDARASGLRVLYLSLSRQWISRSMTHGLAASHKAAPALFAHNWISDPRVRVLHCGIDLTPFNNLDRTRSRADLGLRPENIVLGHVGRLESPKNQHFLIQLASHAVRLDSSVRLLLIGDGSLRTAITQQIAREHLQPYIIMTGSQSDIPRLLSAMDAFVLPSLYEGLPLSLLEAQAAGLPCVISDTITKELDVLPNSIHRLSLADGANIWAQRAVASIRHHRPVPCPVRALSASSFNIHHSVHELSAIYGGS